MAKRARKAQREKISLKMQLRHYYGYAEYYGGASPFTSLQLINGGAEAAEDIDVVIEGEGGFLLPFSRHFDELPFESAAEIAAADIASPLYLAELSQTQVVQVCVRALRGKEMLAEEKGEVTLLPLDMWCGRSGSVEQLACFVRPRLADCLRILEEARAQLKKWEITCEWNGYAEGDKNKLRKMAAAVFAAVKKAAISKAGDSCDYAEPVPVVRAGKLLKEKCASALELALFFAACFESAGLHPVLALGEKSVACGVWLYDNCFADGASDDISLLSQYISEGINNIAMFDVEDAFAGKNANYTAAEKHFARKCAEECYDTVIDVRRCRLARVRPLPLKVKGERGAELLSEEDTDLTAAPADIAAGKTLAVDTKMTRNKQWERRLLDLSLKNALLNFRPEKYALHAVSCDVNETFDAVAAGDELALLESTADLRAALPQEVYFPRPAKLVAAAELVALELKNRRFRTFAGKEKVAEVLRYLQKKAKTAEEEAGADVLFLAFGFLKWFTSDDAREPKYAPLILQPVRLVRSRGGKGLSVIAAGEVQFNNTLLEFLMREFKIDIRGLDNIGGALRPSEVLAMVRAAILNMKRWEVSEEVYLAQFSFARYAMWNDVRKNIDAFAKNPVIRSLLDNRLQLENAVFENKAEDEHAPAEIVSPLPADSSQFAAVAEAVAGATFVLHGPPGTGKSQTITNIIANCLLAGKRVLFVAEKQAALSVVKKRMDGIGIGDFCLELHSGKADKQELLKKMDETLSLSAQQDDAAFLAKAEQIARLRASLNAPVEALHRKRRLGVSLYEAILVYEKNKDAPDVLDIESTFYDRLTKENLERYEGMVAEAAAAVEQCGGVRRSPFENVNLRKFDASVRERVFTAAQAMLAEIRHLQNFLQLFLEFYRQKISTFTPAKLRALEQLLEILRSGEADKYYRCESEAQFHAFFNADRRLNEELGEYGALFRTLVDIDCDPAALEQELENYAANPQSSRLLSSVAKRLRRAAAEKLAEGEEYKYISLLANIYRDLRLLRENTSLSENFSDRAGRIVLSRRSEFMEGMNGLQELAGQLFMDYNADSFNGRCVQSANGDYAGSVLNGLQRAIACFESCRKEFCAVISAAEEDFADEDLLAYFRAKASALIDNIDMLGAWCVYKDAVARLDEEGLLFIGKALRAGALDGETLLPGFRKNIYLNFIRTNLASDPVLGSFSGAVLEEKIEQFRLIDEEFTRLSKEHIRNTLIGRLPSASEEGPLALEIFNFRRIVKGNLRGMTLKDFFAEVPGLFAKVAPCLLMSPITVARYLQAEPDLFDLVVFDEASQLPTCEAVGALARAKSAVIVGDPKQLPPTSFFSSGYVDEENLDTEDLESILDDCLALSIPEKHLNWHYRSKHESLIAFSNIMYYGNRLCTFPSPDALESHVRLVLCDGVYDRGFTKRNKAEAEALVSEVVRRLSDPKLSRSSIGVVTFSTAQQDYIERRLSEALSKRRLEEAAYEREEPLFVKNLENVQGDERDVILFSVCYGPDSSGRVALNFGPLNQAGGWRRLNVAVSRAREEMLVFSSMTSSMIDLTKTNSRGVAGLKAFLEFAEKGKTSLAIDAGELQAGRDGIGKYIARELESYDYDCRAGLGVSEFKIDCAVLDPRDPKRFILAVLCDGAAAARSSCKDRNILQVQTLKRNNWNVMRVFTVNFFNNPKREVKRIKEMLDKLTGGGKKERDVLSACRRPYRFAALEQLQQNAAYVTGGENDADICARLKAIVAAEEPVGEAFLMRRCLDSLGIRRPGAKVEERLRALIGQCAFKQDAVLGRTYYYKSEKSLSVDKFRADEEGYRRTEDDFTPYEVLAAAKGVLENKVSLYEDELAAAVCAAFGVQRPGDKLLRFAADCIEWGVQRAVFVRSVSDRISLA